MDRSDTAPFLQGRKVLTDRVFRQAQMHRMVLQHALTALRYSLGLIGGVTGLGMSVSSTQSMLPSRV
jgi:hypothetical protein